MNIEENLIKRTEILKNIVKEDIKSIKLIIDNSEDKISDEDFINLKKLIDEIGTLQYFNYIVDNKILNK